LDPLNVAADELFEVKLIKHSEDEYVLILAMEHMISDAHSMSILIRDIIAGYEGVPALPAVAVQPSDYALWQARAPKHEAYWSQRLAAHGRLRIPGDESQSRDGWGIVPIDLSARTRGELHEWCRARKTTPAMAMFATYAALVLRWCHSTSGVIRFMIDGRSDEKLRNTVGYFAYGIPVPMELRDEDNFLDLLERVTGECARSQEHADVSYLESRQPRPEFTRSPCFNWVPDAGVTETSAPSQIQFTRMTLEAAELPGLERDIEPLLLLFDSPRGIRGGLQFPYNRFSRHTMDRFVCDFQTLLRVLLSRPLERVSSIIKEDVR
jgi:hypothetical protein